MKILNSVVKFFLRDNNLEETKLKIQEQKLRDSFPDVNFNILHSYKNNIKKIKETLERERKIRKILLDNFTDLYLSLISIEDIDLENLKYVSGEFRIFSINICEVFIKDIDDTEKYKNTSIFRVMYKDNYLTKDIENLCNKFDESYPESKQERFEKFISKIQEWHDNKEKRKTIKREGKKRESN